MTPIKAIIFDMDGTLVDNMGIHLDIWVGFLAERGVRVTQQEFHRQTSGQRNPEIMRQFIDPNLTDTQVLDLQEEKESLYRQLHAEHMEPMPGSIEFFETAKAHGLKLAVATSAYRPNVDFTLDGLGIRPYFQAVISAEDVVNGKPHPDPFLLVAQKLGVAPEQCLVFEDAESGVEAARRAGMRVFFITSTTKPENIPDQPHIIGHAPNFESVDITKLV
jgi:beta-phosphoglucomutase family hydrolase